ncbi:MAG: RNA polymerase factor sigma-54 [Bacteroidia bacterium]|jgi:RNA polymerase sigma-54 factor|nr:RNA polymerase factor sigma-54 [Bacteroidia bacterium]
MSSTRLRTHLAQRTVLHQNLHQIQLARLLEVPDSELEKYIEEEIEKNPALDTEEEPISLPEGPLIQNSLRSPAPESDTESGNFPSPLLRSEEPEDYYGPFNYSAPRSLYDTLKEQLSTLDLTERERTIAEYIIGNLNAKGFLEEPLAKIARYLSLLSEFQEAPVSVEEVEAVLRKVQSLDPPGIAARSSQECLLLQAYALPDTDPYKAYFLRLFTEDFALLSRGRLDKIQRKYQIKDEEWQEFLHKLRSFTLNPAANFSDETAPQVTPDFVLHIEEDGALRVELVRYRPIRLRVNAEYRKLLERYTRKGAEEGEIAEVLKHVRERVERAEHFIELLRQREETLLRTAQEIVRHQRPFFLNGCNEKFLRPLILKDIAEAVKVDISTVSRVVNSKYIETPCGIFPLKYFFSEGIRTKEGKKIANKAIKGILRELIQQEDPKAPYSDEKLAQLLQERGIEVKRRTIAKYREQLGIPSARERRRLPPL